MKVLLFGNLGHQIQLLRMFFSEGQSALDRPDIPHSFGLVITIVFFLSFILLALQYHLYPAPVNPQ